MKSRQDVFQALAAYSALPEGRKPPLVERIKLTRAIRQYEGLGKIDDWLEQNDPGHSKTRKIKINLDWLPKDLR